MRKANSLLSFLRRTTAPYLFAVIFVLSVSGYARAQTSAPIESGKFHLHKFEKDIGEETYEVARDGAALVITSKFEFTDRTSPVPLSATLKLAQNLTPLSFEIKGRTSRISTINTSVAVNGHQATITEDGHSREVAAPDRFFTIAGYAPMSVQMFLIRYWNANHVKGELATIPGGSVTVEPRGEDTVESDGKRVILKRYSIGGVKWGQESLWFDSAQYLVAAVTTDAEFDHFEAIKDGFEPSLAFFVSRAAQDGMARLAVMATKLSPSSKATVAIVGGTLIDGTGKPPVADSVVLIKDGRIAAAGPRSGIRIPTGTTVVDAKGKWVLPGLWDMHAHFEQVEWGPVYLAAGVTTVRDVGNEFDFITSVRDAIAAGRGLGPHILAAGIIDGKGPAALGVVVADTPEEARAEVDRYKKAGFQQIKIYSSVKPEVVKAITAEAHSLGMTVTGHIPQGMNATQGVESGMDQINHIQYFPGVMGVKPGKPFDPDSPEAKQALAFFKQHNTVVDPTLSIFELLTHPSNEPVSAFEPGIDKIPGELKGPLNNSGVPAAAAAGARQIFEMFLAVTRALHQAGIPIVAGTDQTIPGHSLHREIELYVKAGFTPMEAIQAATIVPARVMKVDSEVGTVEPGKQGDVIILDGDPLDQISNIRTVRYVIQKGRMFDCAKLWESVGFKP
ncbi:MAG: amidohydrolase family protein [Blastocatellia bacterium]